MAHARAKYQIGEVPATGERIKLCSHPTEVSLWVAASNSDEVEGWVRKHVVIRGPVEIAGLVVEKSLYALCSEAHPLSDGFICKFWIRSAAHAATPPGPDFEILRRRVDDYFGE